MCIRERPFDFYGGGGAGRLRKKKIPAVISGEKILRPEGPAKKKFFGLPWEALLHSVTCFRTPKSAFRTQKSAFAVQNLHFALRKLLYTLQKTTLYTLGMTSLIIKRKYCAVWKNLICNPPPPSPHGLMKWAPWGFLKKIVRPEGPAKKKFSCSKNRQKKKFSGSLKSSCPPPIKIKWLFPK